jgi:hypothetical protein
MFVRSRTITEKDQMDWTLITAFLLAPMGAMAAGLLLWCHVEMEDRP